LQTLLALPRTELFVPAFWRFSSRDNRVVRLSRLFRGMRRGYLPAMQEENARAALALAMPRAWLTCVLC